MARTTRAPVVQIEAAASGSPARTLRLGAALFASFFTHALLLILFLLLGPMGMVRSQPDSEPNITDEQIVADAQEALPVETFDVIDINPASEKTGGDIANDSERRAEITVPGLERPEGKVGAIDGKDGLPPISYPGPRGFGDGIGGVATDGPGPEGPSGPGGGPSWGNPYSFRTAKGDARATRDFLVKVGGGDPRSEVAVARGLMWLVRQQSADGRFRLDGMFKDPGAANDTAGTGLGLLPFLGAGKTHKPSKDNAYDKTVERALRFLMSRQDPKRGELGGGMYGHGIATIALSEAYGLSQDPALRLAAQRAVYYIVAAQHENGGWRYTPGQAGDLSVTGWQVMALKSAQMAGLTVPGTTLKKAERFLDSVAATNDGYGYVDMNPTPTMSAVGLLCRQFMQGWGPQNLRLIKGINANIKPTPPGTRKDAYYHYYATQVMFHFGGNAWKEWNGMMRELLITAQEKDRDNPNFGSWSSLGDTHSSAGGRLMVTSLNLLTLEVYYRYLPLYYRDMGAKM
jgi:hypothetical protein